MKNLKKLASLLLALVMVFSLAITASALDVDTNAGGTATITIENAANGVTYKVYKLFDATVSTDGSSISYTGTIPAGLADYFIMDNNTGNITKNANKTDAEIAKAVQDWATAQEAEGTVNPVAPVGTGTGDGSKLVFTELEYGYYAVTTTQGATVTVDSTKPNASIYDKNSSEPSAEKKVNDEDTYVANIGETVTYTATFNTANYLGEGADSKQVVKYEITDTLPNGVTMGTVSSITIGGTAIATQQFDANGKITIAWVDPNGKSLYANGADIVITYTATVNANAVIDGAGNTNTISLQPYVGDGNDDDNDPDPWEKDWEADATVYTYAAALRKVDGTGKPLAGATFSVTGLVATGDNGLYVVSSYDPDGKDDSDNAIVATVMKTDENGYLVIEGLKSGAELVVSEVDAPAGYNKLTTTLTVQPIVVEEEVESSSGTVYYDAEGKVVDESSDYSYSKIEVATHEEIIAGAENYKVVNQAGAELPSTGGMGTTLFYIFGGILVAAAVVLLVTKKRMNAAE